MQENLETSERKLESGIARRVEMEDSRARYPNAISKGVELQSRVKDSRYGMREFPGRVPGAASLKITVIVGKRAISLFGVRINASQNLD